MKKLTSIFVIGFLLIGCTSKVIITPDKLPDAKFGEPYYVELNINGGSEHISGSSFEYTITPENSGLRLIPDFTIPTSYNFLIISGTPKTLENIHINIKGETVASVLWHSSQKLDKSYIIRVKNTD